MSEIPRGGKKWVDHTPATENVSEFPDGNETCRDMTDELDNALDAFLAGASNDGNQENQQARASDETGSTRPETKSGGSTKPAPRKQFKIEENHFPSIQGGIEEKKEKKRNN